MKEIFIHNKKFRIYESMQIAASEDGEFINMITDKYITPHVCSDGYVEIRQRHADSYQGRKSIGAKRLMIELWKPEWRTKMVSFVDGNNTNLNINNLCITTVGLAPEQVKYLKNELIKDGEFRKTMAPGIWCDQYGRLMRNGRIIDVDYMSCAMRGRNITIYSQGVTYKAAELIYESWTGKRLEEGQHIICKDGNNSNIQLGNLKVVDTEEFNKWRFTRKFVPENIVERIEIRKRELDLIIYFFATNNFDRYHEYIKDTIYPHLIEYGLYKCHRSMDKVRIAAADVVTSIYMMISKGRDIYDYYHMSEKMLWREFRKGDICIRPEKLLDAPPVDDRELFIKLANKYGVLNLDN